MKPALLHGVVMLLTSMACATAAAQQYPVRPIRFITIGGDDAMPRIMAQELSGALGQQVYIEEHAGASGTIGGEAGARAPADGYSFLVATGALMVTPHFYKLSYDILRDFEPVALMATTPFVLLAHPALPVKTLEDLIKLARAKPGQLNYSATSAGSTSMLTTEIFKAAARINIVHIPYKSMAAALVDVVAGQIELGLNVTPSALPQIKANRVRALAVSSTKRSPMLQDVPTFTERGLPQVVATGWFGVLAPAKTPRPVITRMNAEILKALRKPAVRERVLSLALEPAETTPEEFTAHMKADIARWTDAIKLANVPTIGKR